ncbi:histidinol dehydrogenase [Methanocaldococcus infernus ME]|uniref:Histidinol dehydrogenase n=1 Tax=Methanocaldococcus infernus (strain DSM 11812 / JCM 15783 / ME) TaxID=573063 RepID=D5VQB8_METIM|nr:histidinol dehydrogenase [Methanocaldococcus infernus]ADG12771.1 histidinol dehydrogenase [Methanocaldococcus infernus ME]
MIFKSLYELTKEERERIINRNKANFDNIFDSVVKILRDVREKGDEALRYYTKLFDKVEIEDFKVSREEIEEAYNKVDYKVVEALERAKENIYYFHKEQLKNIKELRVERNGVLGQIVRAIEKVGCYVPGGRAFYPSTVLMTTIPAKVAGCKEIYITSPPTPEGKGNAATLIAGDLVKVNGIYKVGGVQAIGALAYGTESIPKVDIIVGPGNIYVTLAKKLVYGEVNIDFLAGPSEVLIIGDEFSNPNYIALDLLAQAEHDPNASCVALLTSREKAEEVKRELEKILKDIDERKEIIKEALKNLAILYGELEDLIKFSNEYAPEHLELFVREPEKILEKIESAGSIFLGEYSPVPIGDYASGTNHVLPTSGFSRCSSGLNVETFLKKITYQKFDKEALRNIKDVVITLAEAEGLKMHAEAVRRRLRE